jgi:crotonobetainyl-CoA:carnitine CoA-transferase CaiB-like acyl-CoA transferase
MAVLAALYRRQETGEGAYIDIAQITAGLQVTGTAVLDYAANGRRYQRTGNRSAQRRAAPHGAYRTAGKDNWIAIAVETEAQWQALRQALGDPPSLADDRFATLAGRLAHEDALDAALEAICQQWERYALMHRLQAAGVPAGVVQRPSDRLGDPQLAADGHFIALPHPEIGTRLTENPPLHFSAATVRAGGPAGRAAPTLGQDDAYVYGELLGLLPETIATLRHEGVIL